MKNRVRLVFAGLFLICCSVFAKEKKSDFQQLIQQCAEAKTSDEQYKAFDSYLIVHALPSGFLEEANRYGSGKSVLSLQTIENVGVVCQIGGYRYPSGFVVFIDIEKDEIILIDTEYELGELNVKTIPYPSIYSGPEALFPQTLFIVKYLSGTGTGWTMYSEKIYTIDRGSVQLSFNEPCYEEESVYSGGVITFERKNSYVPRKNGLYEIYISGLVKRDPDNAPAVVHQLPMEVYAWNTLTRQFDQISGRKNSRGGSLSNIYTDIVNPDDPDFKTPIELNGNDRFGRVLKKGLFEENEYKLPELLPSGAQVGAGQTVDYIVNDEEGQKSVRFEYVLVYPDETLDDVARNYGVSKETIMAVNAIQSESDVREGMTVRIPFEK